MKKSNSPFKLGIKILFAIGLLLLLALSAYLGWEISEKTVMQSVLRDGWEVPITTHSLPVAIWSGLGLFVLFGVIWWFICKFINSLLKPKDSPEDKDEKSSDE